MSRELLAKNADIWDGEIVAVVKGNHKILLAKIDGQICAYHDVCPHKGVPLSRGVLDGTTLKCFAHQWCFDLKTGHGINPVSTKLRKYEITCEDGNIYCELEGNHESSH